MTAVAAAMHWQNWRTLEREGPDAPNAGAWAPTCALAKPRLSSLPRLCSNEFVSTSARLARGARTYLFPRHTNQTNFGNVITLRHLRGLSIRRQSHSSFILRISNGARLTVPLSTSKDPPTPIETFAAIS